eukprot:8539225-Karenia_brevis.AAC.1
MQLNKALKILQPERPGDRWTELWIPKDGSSYKMYVNRDASEQMQRLQLLQRKVKEACKELYPGVALVTPRIKWHPSEQLQALCRSEAQDLI